MSAIEHEAGGRVVSNQGVLDFSHLHSPDELASIERIENVGAVIVPESLATAYARIPTGHVGSTIFVPDDSRPKVHVGQVLAGGDGLGTEEDVVVVIGMLVITSPVTEPLPRQIHAVGAVLAPEGSEAVLGPRLASTSGSVHYYPYVQGQHARVMSGQVTLEGSTLANRGGTAGDILIGAGQVVIASPATEVGFRQIVASGQLLAPVQSRGILEPKLEVQGQVSWYRGDEVRLFMEDTTLGPDYFRLLDRTVSLAVFAHLALTGPISEDVLRQKLKDIILFGNITAPAELIPLLQVLARDSFGSIRAAEEPIWDATGS
ncbi:MAG TPA: hypothetical protein VKV06_10880 [Acidimicrobiales bacterium]|nr:hypothetical protein [Acidimicrobiales bacterium]